MISWPKLSENCMHINSPTRFKKSPLKVWGVVGKRPYLDPCLIVTNKDLQQNIGYLHKQVLQCDVFPHLHFTSLFHHVGEVPDSVTGAYVMHCSDEICLEMQLKSFAVLFAFSLANQQNTTDSLSYSTNYISRI